MFLEQSGTHEARSGRLAKPKAGRGVCPSAFEIGIANLHNGGPMAAIRQRLEAGAIGFMPGGRAATPGQLSRQLLASGDVARPTQAPHKSNAFRLKTFRE